MEEILHQLISSLVIYKVLYIRGGAGFLPSTVWHEVVWIGAIHPRTCPEEYFSIAVAEHAESSGEWYMKGALMWWKLVEDLGIFADLTFEGFWAWWDITPFRSRFMKGTKAFKMAITCVGVLQTIYKNAWVMNELGLSKHMSYETNLYHIPAQYTGWLMDVDRESKNGVLESFFN